MSQGLNRKLPQKTIKSKNCSKPFSRYSFHLPHIFTNRLEGHLFLHVHALCSVIFLSFVSIRHTQFYKAPIPSKPAENNDFDCICAVNVWAINPERKWWEKIIYVQNTTYKSIAVFPPHSHSAKCQLHIRLRLRIAFQVDSIATGE